MHISDTPLGTAYDVTGQFVSATEAQRTVAAVWAAGTWIYRNFAVYPRIYFTAEEPQSGKSTFMDIVTMMSANHLSVGYSSQASVYSYLDEHPDTTLGLDEADQIFGATGRKTSRSVLLAVLNDGYSARGRVLVVRGGKAVQMPVYCPIALSGIGTLPDALLSRCAVIHLEKAAPEMQYIPELYAGDLEGIGKDLGDWLKTSEAQKAIRQAPFMADVDGDPRFRQIMAPLFAIAEYAGCGDEFLQAVHEMQTGIAAKPKRTRAQWLIHDLRECWPDGATQLTGEQVISVLKDHDSRRWDKISATRIGEMTVADMLRSEGIESKASNGKRGYRVADVFGGKVAQ